MVTRCWEWDWKLTVNEQVGYFEGDGFSKNLDYGDVCTTLKIY